MITCHIPPDDPGFILEALRIADIDPEGQGLMLMALDKIPRTRRASLLNDLIDSNTGHAVLILGAAPPDDAGQKKLLARHHKSEPDFSTPSIEELNWMFPGHSERSACPEERERRREESGGAESDDAETLSAGDANSS
jgi:hypothetical protein